MLYTSFIINMSSSEDTQVTKSDTKTEQTKPEKTQKSESLVGKAKHTLEEIGKEIKHGVHMVSHRFEDETPPKQE